MKYQVEKAPIGEWLEDPRTPGPLLRILSSQPWTRGHKYLSLQYMEHTGQVYNVQEPRTDDYELQDADPTTVKLYEQRGRDKKLLSASSTPHMASVSGTDPEIFVVHQDGTVFPAGEFLPDKNTAFEHRKDRARLTGDASSDSYMNYVYWDGLQAEMHTQPMRCLEYHVDNIRVGLTLVRKAALAKDPNAKLTHKPVLPVSRDVLTKLPVPQVSFGCKPSLNAWDLHGVEVGDPTQLPVRFAGGHYHLGMQVTPKVASDMVHAADVIAAVPAVAMFQKVDDPVRRRFYGLPGEYRMTAYGLEYRVLSSAWLVHPAITHFTLGLVRTALRAGLNQDALVFEYDPFEMQRIIMEGDVDGAIKHVKRNEKQYRWLLAPVIEKSLSESFMSSANTTKILDACMRQLQRPVEETVGTDVAQNWLLDNPWLSRRPESAAEGWGPHSTTPGCTWQSLVLSGGVA